MRLSASLARPGDAVILSGSIGDHGIAILSEREGLELESEVASDSAALHTLVDAMFEASGAGAIRCMRAPTRGGVASTLNEIAQAASLRLCLEDQLIPVRDDVHAACEMLGLDPLLVACEGRFAAFVAPRDAARALAILQRSQAGAARIGEVAAEMPAVVALQTALGPSRILEMPSGEQLPRIC